MKTVGIRNREKAILNTGYDFMANIVVGMIVIVMLYLITHLYP